HVVRVRRTGGLGDDVVDAQGFEDGAHRTTGDDAGTRNGCTQHDLAGAVAAGDVVVRRTGGTQRHADHLALGLFRCLADCLGNFTGLTVTETDATLLVTYNDEGCEAKALTALHNLGHTVDVDQAIDELAFALLNVSAHNIFSSPLLELQTALTGSVCKGLNTAMIDIGATVEHDLGHTGLHATLGDQLAHGHGRLGIAAVLERTAHVLFQGRGSGQRTARRIVDDLGVDILVRAEHAETETTKG